MSFAVATAVRGLCGGVGRGAASAARAALAAATAKMVAPLAVATTAAVEAGAAAHMTTPPELAQVRPAPAHSCLVVAADHSPGRSSDGLPRGAKLRRLRARSACTRALQVVVSLRGARARMALVDGGPTRVAPREIPDSPTRYNVLKREYEKQVRTGVRGLRAGVPTLAAAVGVSETVQGGVGRAQGA